MRKVAIVIAATLALFPQATPAQFELYEHVRTVPGGLAVLVERGSYVPAPMGRIVVGMDLADIHSVVAVSDEQRVERALAAFGGMWPKASTPPGMSPSSALVYAEFTHPTHGLAYAVVNRIRALTFTGAGMSLNESITYWTNGCGKLIGQARTAALRRADEIIGEYATRNGLTLGTGRTVISENDAPPQPMRGDICLAGFGIPRRFDPDDPSKPYLAGAVSTVYVRYDLKN